MGSLILPSDETKARVGSVFANPLRSYALQKFAGRFKVSRSGGAIVYV